LVGSQALTDYNDTKGSGYYGCQLYEYIEYKERGEVKKGKMPVSEVTR